MLNFLPYLSRDMLISAMLIKKHVINNLNRTHAAHIVTPFLFCVYFISRDFSAMHAHEYLSVDNRSHNFPRNNGLFRYQWSGARPNARDQIYTFSQRKVDLICGGKAYLVRVPSVFMLFVIDDWRLWVMIIK